MMKLLNPNEQAVVIRIYMHYHLTRTSRGDKHKRVVAYQEPNDHFLFLDIKWTVGAKSAELPAEEGNFLLHIFSLHSHNKLWRAFVFSKSLNFNFFPIKN